MTTATARTAPALSVTLLEDYALANNESLVTLELGTLDKLSEGVFYGLWALESLPEISDKITEIPDYAFYGCGYYGVELDAEQLPFENITSIGKGAFQMSALKGAVSLPKIKALGEYAFYRTGLTELTLPETVTELPDGLIGGQLNKLSAPGVTVIGKDVLNGSGEKLDIDFSKVTKIGERGLMNLHFDKPTTFSSLTELGDCGLMYASGEELSMPAMTEIVDSSMSSIECVVDAPNVKKMTHDKSTEVYNLHCEGLIVGDALESIDRSFNLYANYFAGPADSPLKDYAQSVKVPYYTLPFLTKDNNGHVSADVMNAFQNSVVTLNAKIMRADPDTVKWYTVENGKETEIKNAKGLSFNYYAKEAGDFTIRASLPDKGNSQVVNFKLHITPTAQLSAEKLLLSDGETYLIDWNKVREFYPEYEKKGYTGTKDLSCMFEFTPAQDGDYTFYGIDDVNCNAYLIDSQSAEQTWIPEHDCRFTASSDYPCCMYVLKDKKHISTVSYTLSYTTDRLTQKFRSVKFELRDDDTILKKNEDYTYSLLTDDDGNYYAAIQGIGGYCGYMVKKMDKIEDDNSGSRMLKLDTPTLLTLNKQGDIEANSYHLELHEQTTIKMERLNGKGNVYAHITSEVYGGGYIWYADTREATTLSAGEYNFYIEADQSDNRPVVFQAATVVETIFGADAAAADCVYTGKAVTPDITVTLDGETLVQGVDYTVKFDREPVECGCYTVTIEGIGRFTDSVVTNFHVIPQQDAAKLPALTEGTHEIKIADAGQSVFYQWKPEKTDYCFIKNDIQNSAIRIFDENMKELQILNDIAYHVMPFEAEAGKQYFVSVSYKDPTLTGTTDLTLSSGCRLLSECTAATDHNTVTAADGIPAITVTDGETKLTEGTDYKVLITSGTAHLGRSFVTLRGIGNYAGDLDVEFNVAPEKLTEAPDPQERGEIPEISMALNEEYAVPHGHLGEARVFTYTTEKDGTYYLTLPDTLADEISAFVYNGAGNCVPQPANGISLKKGEKCAVYCVANFILEDEIKSDYTIMISDIDTSAEYEVNGIVYRLTKDGAVLVRLNTDAVGIEIPDTITITALDQSFPFAGIDAIGFRSYADNCTIYGTLGGTVHTYCRENGYCFAGLDPSATAAGDVTGDQIVDSDDVLTLTRWIAQCKGMRLNDTAFAQADIN